MACWHAGCVTSGMNNTNTTETTYAHGKLAMNKADALREWRGHYLPAIKEHYEADGIPDYPARCESWGAFTDMLCKERRITLKQYESWHAPSECGR